MKDNDLISRKSLIDSLNRFAPEHFSALVNDLIMKEPAVSFPQAHENDLISRQAAIDAMATWDWQDAYLPIHFKQLLEVLPSAQPEQRWIPCSERLPEEDGLYLVTTSKGQVQVHVFSHNGNSEEYWMRCDKAWMPLPEPYREEERRMSEVCRRGYKCMCFQCGEKDCEKYESEPPEWIEKLPEWIEKLHENETLWKELEAIAEKVKRNETD